MLLLVFNIFMADNVVKKLMAELDFFFVSTSLANTKTFHRLYKAVYAKDFLFF